MAGRATTGSPTAGRIGRDSHGLPPRTPGAPGVATGLHMATPATRHHHRDRRLYRGRMDPRKVPPCGDRGRRPTGRGGGRKWALPWAPAAGTRTTCRPGCRRLAGVPGTRMPHTGCRRPSSRGCLLRRWPSPVTLASRRRRQGHRCSSSSKRAVRRAAPAAAAGVGAATLVAAGALCAARALGSRGGGGGRAAAAAAPGGAALGRGARAPRAAGGRRRRAGSAGHPCRPGSGVPTVMRMSWRGGSSASTQVEAPSCRSWSLSSMSLAA
mmetsp:Transcript_73227/g.228412  ORF Transcript_73227/g.228412 Transcript_73227/m.228412 type:complete len:268 (-) Transcript_73227:211-1014(-)